MFRNPRDILSGEKKKNVSLILSPTFKGLRTQCWLSSVPNGRINIWNTDKSQDVDDVKPYKVKIR